MSIFDKNRKISSQHIDINKNGAKKWYEQLGATTTTLDTYTYGITENEIEYYDAINNKKEYKTFDCIKLDGDVYLNFSDMFSTDDLYNNYIFLKYYYTKYYYYDGEEDRPIYRWKYSVIDEEKTFSVLGNAFHLDMNGDIWLPKGEYSLKGWEIIKISREPVADYYYADDYNAPNIEKHIINCKRDKNNKVKDNSKIDKVIDSNYIKDASYGNYAFYSIPSYGMTGKNIRIFGDLDRKDAVGNYYNLKNKNGIEYYYNNDSNKKVSFEFSSNSKYFREEYRYDDEGEYHDEYYPIILFNDFGWHIDNIPSEANPLKITKKILNDNKIEIIISFKNDTKTYTFQADDKIILYARECVDFCQSLPKLSYGIIDDENNFCFYGTLKNDNFNFKLKNIEMYDFDSFLDNNNNNFTLGDTIDLSNVPLYEYTQDEYNRYHKIITSEDYVEEIPNNNFISGSDSYNNKYGRDDVYNFFFSTFNYDNLVDNMKGNIYFNYDKEPFLNNYKWEMELETDKNNKYIQNGTLSGDTSSINYNTVRKITLTNNTILFNKYLKKNNEQNNANNKEDKEDTFYVIPRDDYSEYYSYNDDYMMYSNTFKTEIKIPVGLIKQGFYKMKWEQTSISREDGIIRHNTNTNNTTTTSYEKVPDNLGGDTLFLRNNNNAAVIQVQMNHSLLVNNSYSKNVNQPAIAIVLWTKHEYR